MPNNKEQHYVPRHYLRQFRVADSELIGAARIDPYRYCGSVPISSQCKAAYFYGKDSALDAVLQQGENDIAPTLVRVIQRRTFNDKELVALRLLVVLLEIRTEKASEEAKVFDRYVAHEYLQSAIRSGRLPEPKGGLKPEMIDFEGMPGALIDSAAISCWMELQTTRCKLLAAASGTQFVTSDNPVVLLNQLLDDAHPGRSFAGYSRSGIQCILPISPDLCLFVYDPKVYNVGSHGPNCVPITSSDVAIINSLQVQSANKCDLTPVVGQLETRVPPGFGFVGLF